MLAILLYGASSFFFFIIDLYFLIPEVIKHFKIFIAESAIVIETPTKEIKAEIVINPLIVEVTKSDWLI